MSNEVEDYGQRWSNFLSYGGHVFSEELLTPAPGVGLIVAPDGSKISVIDDDKSASPYENYDEQAQYVQVDLRFLRRHSLMGFNYSSLSCPACEKPYTVSFKDCLPDDILSINSAVIYINRDGPFFDCACGVDFFFHDRYEFLYPVLIHHGEQGSAKSTAQSMGRSLIDPNSSPLRTERLCNPAIERFQAMTDEVKQLPDEQEDKSLPIYKKSLIGRWSSERWSVLRELWRGHIGMVDFYMSPQGGKLSMEDAQKITSGEYAFTGDRSEEGRLTLAPRSGSQEERADSELSQTLSWDVDNLSWYALDHLFRADPDLAEQVWDEVKEAAARDFKSGHFAAELFERTEWQKNVWKRAHFVAVFQMMVESYKPRDAIEHQMVEMAAVEYFLWRHWTGEHLQRATSEPRRESYEYKEWREKEKETWCRYSGQRREIQGQWIAGAWEMPYQSEADAVQQAAELADRFRRAYHASVRALRDWRRYPVIVQNAGQVNIAAEGGQQMNLQKRKQSKKRKESGSISKSKQSSKRNTKPKSKQLGAKSPDESILMKPASESVLVE